MFPISRQAESLTRLAHEAAFRHQVLSRNLANVNTPHYQREEVVLSSNSAPASSVPGNFEEAGLRIVKDSTPSLRTDGNNVDLEQELGAIQQNSLAYQSVLQLLAAQISALRTAIQG
jgi:flagellar basal-body rod protein FlgB